MVLRCAVVCCSVWQCVLRWRRRLSGVVACCSVLQRVAMCCSVLQCDQEEEMEWFEMCCNRLQYVAVCLAQEEEMGRCCSVLQCFLRRRMR